MKLFQLGIFKKYDFEEVEKFLFFILLAIFLIPVWWNKFFLTGDGPCHLYNSKVLLDFITSNNLEFYKEYYFVNNNLEPNWFSHVTLAFLLYVFPNYLAEKIFISTYIISFAFTFRLLLKTINKENIFLAILGLPFIFHHTFQMGFYNYSFSFVFFFFCVRYWLKHYTNFSATKVLVFAAMNILLYFTHPIGLLLSALTIASIIAVGFIIEFIKSKGPPGILFRKLFRSSALLFVGFLPAMLLMVSYIFRKGLNSYPNPDSFKNLYHAFLELTSLITMTNKEPMWAISLSILFGATFIYAIYTKLKTRKFNHLDGLFVVFAVMLYVYFNQPGGMSGAGILSIRLQFIPYLLVLLWFGNIKFGTIFKKVFTVLIFVIGVILAIIRFQHHVMASEAVGEYLSAVDYIENKSTVLPLSYSFNGKTPQGELIANRIWLFKHASDYLGTEKSLILFGNYEGNTGFFPIIWREDKNPFRHISIKGGIEHQPPAVDIVNYHKKTGGEINYVITWCLDEQYMGHVYTQDILKQLADNYNLVFTSKNKRVKLYKQK